MARFKFFNNSEKKFAREKEELKGRNMVKTILLPFELEKDYSDEWSRSLDSRLETKSHFQFGPICSSIVKKSLKLSESGRLFGNTEKATIWIPNGDVINPSLDNMATLEEQLAFSANHRSKPGVFVYGEPGFEKLRWGVIEEVFDDYFRCKTKEGYRNFSFHKVLAIDDFSSQFFKTKITFSYEQVRNFRVLEVSHSTVEG